MFESREIAQYLTLADFYYFKCISAFEYLNGPWRAGTQAGNKPECNSYPSHSYVLRMTKRANMVSGAGGSSWVVELRCNSPYFGLSGNIV
jgi:hypothetical protein